MPASAGLMWPARGYCSFALLLLLLIERQCRQRLQGRGLAQSGTPPLSRSRATGCASCSRFAVCGA